ncbi:sporulation protein [Planctomycetes bacterium TBK1r]|uniref:Arrestin-like N-terminal domain-containing protein n=1 Tax=Stieleria magnilauensis TaxID=2527963 RepID=A0ABX5Y8I6_9BACT|nr:hypothetical protein TBK1r_77090 [Planctomycetes bacterium TBK1r]
MAKCDLSIELDHPERIYSGGDKITGTLHVLADADVKCKGLEVSSGWRTHGRGNIARGVAESITLFVGEWTSGQRESYRFELEVADWPPSYHGNYINVDHYIDARAKIPWAFDPKASQEFVMRPATGPDTADAQVAAAVGGCIGYGLVALVLGLMVVAFGFLIVTFVVNPFAGLVAGAIIIPLVGFFVAKKLLPKWLLGNVQAELLTPQVAPGDRVRARLAFQPKRRFTINSISAELTGTEVCVSGSGSNRTTHRHTFFTDRHELEGQSTLQAGDRKEFNLDFPIPGDVPYSFDLADNDLNWTIDLRVDIPRWPDWTQSLKLLVHPNGQPIQRPETTEPHAALGATDDGTDAASPQHDEITFAETATHLWEARHDAEQVDLLVEAVTGMTFEIDTFIERRLLYSGEEDPHVYDDGYAVWARHSDPPLPLVLYIPHELADEFEQAGRDLWRCRGTIVGWDHQHRRLQIKVLVR